MRTNWVAAYCWRNRYVSELRFFGRLVMHFDEISGRLMAGLIEAEALGLPQDDVDNISVLVSAGEYGLALEDLCTQLYEFSVPVTADLRRDLGEVGAAMGIDQHYWVILEELDPARRPMDEAAIAHDIPGQ